MIKIQDAIQQLLAEYSRQEIADAAGITPPMISKWSNPENDFTPRLKVAANLYKAFGIVVYPYSEEALIEESGEGNDS